ncbi:hypothetical protein [Olivibacter domesticus]|uniref:Uncharacterized protein n=1 Tax=Olivibacter domesticus TaxID=407022 RepID=A0A1H7IE56_OLID1|nr:hypothetical protein [Olivibacter domesticus]SEK60786.1 hypothetical protein SAMN05661044_00672 [Olivibacter domesticus]
MNIELKNIQHTEEPYPGYQLLPQKGDLYINGTHVGDFISTGIGRSCFYNAKDQEAAMLIEEAEKDFNRQPEMYFPSLSNDTRGIYFQPSIELEIMKELFKFNQQERENSTLEYWDLVAGKQADNIVVGNPDSSLVTHSLPRPTAVLVEHPSLTHMLMNFIEHQVMPTLGEGDRILNHNIPEKTLEWCGLKPYQYLSAIGIKEDNTGHRMKIEAKNIQHETLLPQGPRAFCCDIYIDGIPTGYCSKYGTGKQTHILPIVTGDKDAVAMLKLADAICSKLPTEIAPRSLNNSKKDFPTALARFLEGKIGEVIEQQEAAKFVLEEQVDSIVIGRPSLPNLSFKLSRPIDMIVADPFQWYQISDVLRRKVLPNMGTDEKVLNTNIPEAVFKLAGLKDGQYTLSNGHQKEDKKARHSSQRPG